MHETNNFSNYHTVRRIHSIYFMKQFTRWVNVYVLAFVLGWGFSTTQVSGQQSDAGMWLLPQIPGPVHQSLTQKGLALPESAFYPSLPSTLNRAIVRINVGEGGGGTGSFVSSSGLILTNHHVAYDAIAAASTANKNYLNDGFLSKSLKMEIPAVGYSLYIPVDQVEVTQQLQMALLQAGSKPEQEVLNEAKQAIIASYVGNNEDLTAEIDDYWAGNRQFISVYRIIRDVRLVFAPPSSIGKFGGDIDNWMWPRHTGDFTFLRAYVSKEGRSTPFDVKNVPFKPERHLSVSANGYKDGDFTMVLGFPGSTYRYESSYHFRYYEQAQHPSLIRVFKGIMAGLEAKAATSPEAEVETASDRASYANSLKYFEGVHKGFKDYQIVDQRKKQEDDFERWVASDPIRKANYSDVIPIQRRAYEGLAAYDGMIYTYVYILNNSTLLELAGMMEPVFSYADGSSTELDLSKAQRDSIKTEADLAIKGMDKNVELVKMRYFLKSLALLPPAVQPASVRERFEGLSEPALEEAIQRYLDQQEIASVLLNQDRWNTFWSSDTVMISASEVDPFVVLFKEIMEGYFTNIQGFQESLNAMADAKKGYVKAMLAYKNDILEYPDANFTLRLSGGRVQNIFVRDTTFASQTFIDELMPKYTGKDPFELPKVQMAWINRIQTQRKKSPKLAQGKYAQADGRLVVNFLSTNDITGGNSGSPVLNGKGEMIGVAFDGLIEGVVSDYFHDPSLSRTISVDIRYVLHITDELYGLKHLITELGVKTSSKPVKKTK